jgi:hypothetical protein
MVLLQVDRRIRLVTARRMVLTRRMPARLRVVPT